jgi:hypothetical protein
VEHHADSGTHEAPHLPFVAFWLIAAGLALAWNSRIAAHLVALAALPWWVAAAVELATSDVVASFILADGAALLLGGGLVLAATPSRRLVCFGAVLSAYGAFSLAGVAVMGVAMSETLSRPDAAAASQPLWAIFWGVAGAVFAVAAAAMSRRAGAALAAAAIALVLATVAPWRLPQAGEPWLAYALELCAMLCLVASGMLDSARPRIVAGWIGIGGIIAAITWVVRGSLLRRSIFLAAAGAVAVVLATALNRLLPRTRQ